MKRNLQNPSTVAILPSTPKARLRKNLISANVQLLIEQVEAGHSEGLHRLFHRDASIP